MNMMAVRNNDERTAHKYYYGDFFQSSVPHYRAPTHPASQPVCTSYSHANYPLTSFHGYQQAIVPSNNMSSFPQQDIKEYFFDLECPELIDGTYGASPTASSFTSGTSYNPPSPSCDAKDLTLRDHGAPVYSPAGNLSPLSNFNDSYLNTESSHVWPVQPIAPSCDLSQQFIPDMWPCSQYPSAPPFFDENLRRLSTMTAQPHNDLYPSVPLDGLYPMSYRSLVKAPTLEQGTMSFLGGGDDALVVPGHIFNSNPDGFAFDNPSSAFFPTPSIVESTVEPASVSVSEMDSPPETVPATTSFLPDVARNARDEYLQEARRRGLSYKEIKRRGGFTEAESTLRGRIRILSKPKEMRVRKPQWRRGDIMLLREAVACFSSASQGSSTRKTNAHQKDNMGKLPWKKVAEWMLERGASYPFAGATCAKKWEQIRNLSF